MNWPTCWIRRRDTLIALLLTNAPIVFRVKWSLLSWHPGFSPTCVPSLLSHHHPRQPSPSHRPHFALADPPFWKTLLYFLHLVTYCPPFKLKLKPPLRPQCGTTCSLSLPTPQHSVLASKSVEIWSPALISSLKALIVSYSSLHLQCLAQVCIEGQYSF